MIPFLKKVNPQDLRENLELHASRQIAKDTYILKLTNNKDPLFKQIEKQFLEQMQVHNGLEVHIQCINVISNKEMKRNFCKMAHFINTSMKKEKPHKEITKLESFYLNQLPEERRTNFNSDVPDCYPALFTVPPKAMESIALNGMHNSKYSITPLVESLFGKGIYCHVNSYQHPQENTDLTENEDHTSNEVMCIAYVIPGNILPVTKVDTAANRPAAEGYHSHFSVTRVKKPETSLFLRWKDFAAARELPDQHYPIEVETESFSNTHMVVFDKRQILPQYFIEYVIRKERKSNLDLDFLHRLNGKRPDAKSVIIIPVSKKLKETHAMGIPIVNKMEEGLLMGEELLISEGKHKMTDVLLSKKQRIRGQSQAPEKVKMLLTGQLVLYDSLDHLTIIGGQVFLTGDSPILHYCIFKNTRIVSERNSRPILSKCKFINCTFDIRDESALTKQHCSVLNTNIELHNQASFHLNATNIKGGYVLVKDTSTFTAHQNCTLKALEVEQRDSCSIYIEKCVLIDGFNLFQAEVDASSWLEIKDSKCIKIYQILVSSNQAHIKNTSFKGCQTALKIVDREVETQLRLARSPQKNKAEIQVERCIFNTCETAITQESNLIHLNINHCTFINATNYGFASKRSSKASIEENLFHNSVVRFEGKSNVFFKRNKVTCDKQETEIDACLVVNHLATPNIKLNKFAAPHTTGILLLRHSQPHIEQNNFIGMSTGLKIQGSAKPYVANNVFGSCNVGIQVDMNEPVTFASNRFEKCKDTAYNITSSPSGVEINNEEFKICKLGIRGNLKCMTNCKAFKTSFDINLSSKFTSNIDQCTFEAKSNVQGRVHVFNSVFKSESNMTVFEGSTVDKCTIEYPARITFPESANHTHTFSATKKIHVGNCIFNYPSYLDDNSEFLVNEPVIYVAQPIYLELKSNRWSTKKSFPILLVDHADSECHLSSSTITDTGNVSLKNGRLVRISDCQFGNIDAIQVSESLGETIIENCSFSLGTTAVFESKTTILDTQFNGSILKLFNEQVTCENSSILNQSTCLLYSGHIKSTKINNSDMFVSTRVGSEPVGICIEGSTLIENGELRVESDASLTIKDSTIRNVNINAKNQSTLTLATVDLEQSSLSISNSAKVVVEALRKIQGTYGSLSPFNVHGSGELSILHTTLTNINLDVPIFDIQNNGAMTLVSSNFTNCSNLVHMNNQASLNAADVTVEYEDMAASESVYTAIVAKEKSVIECHNLTVGTYKGCIFTIEGEAKLTLSNSNLRDTKQAINLMSSTPSIIEACRFFGENTTLFFSKKGAATLTNCEFGNNNQSVFMTDEASLKFEACEFSNVVHGLVINENAIVNLNKCALKKVKETGIQCNGKSKLTISQLSVFEAIIGILAAGESLITCVQSNFSSCSKAAVLTKERACFYGNALALEDILSGNQYAFLATNQSKILLNDPEFPKTEGASLPQVEEPNLIDQNKKVEYEEEGEIELKEVAPETPLEKVEETKEPSEETVDIEGSSENTRIALKCLSLAGLACCDAATIRATNVLISQSPIGAFVQDNGTLQLTDCHFENNEVGVDGCDASSNTSMITTSTFTKNHYGIKMKKSNMKMDKNILKKNKVGVYISDTSEVTLTENTAMHNAHRNVFVVDRNCTVHAQKNKTTNLLFCGNPICDRIPFYFLLISFLNLLSIGMTAYAIFILVGMVPQIDLHKTIWGLSNSQTLEWQHWASVGVNAGSIICLTLLSLVLSIVSCIQSKRGYPFVRYIHLVVAVLYLIVSGLFSAFYHYLTYSNDFHSIISTLLKYGFPYIQGALGLLFFSIMLLLFIVQVLPVNLTRKYYQRTWMKEHAVQLNLNSILSSKPRSAESNLSTAIKKQSIACEILLISFHVVFTLLNLLLTIYGVFLVVGCFSVLGDLHALIWGQTITFEWYHIVSFAVAGIYALFQTIGNLAFTFSGLFRNVNATSIINIVLQVFSLLLAAAFLGFFHYLTYNISLLNIYYYYGFIGGLLLLIIIYTVLSWILFSLKLVQRFKVDMAISFKPIVHPESKVVESTTLIQDIVEDPPTPPPQDGSVNDQSLDQYGDDDRQDENDPQNDIPATPRTFASPIREEDGEEDEGENDGEYIEEEDGEEVEGEHVDEYQVLNPEELVLSDNPNDVDDSGFVVHQVEPTNQVHEEIEDDEEDLQQDPHQEGSTTHDDVAAPQK